MKFMSIKAAASEAEKNFMAGKDYMGLVGCLLFLTNRTRVDCAFHVAFLAQYMSKQRVFAPTSDILMLLQRRTMPVSAIKSDALREALDAGRHPHRRGSRERRGIVDQTRERRGNSRG